jgi:hypothetical protein
MSLDEDDLTINRIYLTWPPDKYDICISIVVVNGAGTGKKAQVWKCTNFDAGLYDITSFLWVLIISIYQSSVIFGFLASYHQSSSSNLSENFY